MKKILCFVLAIVCLLAFAGCGGAKKAEAPAGKAAAEKVLRVGTDADYPPFEFYQEKSKAFTGFDIELMEAVAIKEMGYSRVEFVNMEFDSLLASLNDKKVDAVISCVTVTPDRQKIADFTDPYLDSSGVAVAGSGTKFNGPDAMKDKRIAVEAGSVHVKEAKKYSGNVIECGGAEEALRMVTDKKADFAIMDNYTARFHILHNFKSKLAVVTEMHEAADAGIAIAVARGNREMLDKLNAGLKNFRTTADFYQLKNTYFGKLQ